MSGDILKTVLWYFFIPLSGGLAAGLPLDSEGEGQVNTWDRCLPLTSTAGWGNEMWTEMLSRPDEEDAHSDSQNTLEHLRPCAMSIALSLVPHKRLPKYDPYTNYSQALWCGHEQQNVRCVDESSEETDKIQFTIWWTCWFLLKLCEQMVIWERCYSW